MGVTTSNTDMFTIDTAMGMLVDLQPDMPENKRVEWRNKGSDAILKEVNRIKKEAKVAKASPTETEEKDVATGTVAKKGK